MMLPYGDGGGRWSVFDRVREELTQCTCVRDCDDDPHTACSLSGTWHVHPGEPCPVHPEAEGDR